MNRTMSNETRIKKAIRMISEGCTWQEIASYMDVSVSYIQRLVREYYKTPKRYNNLLKKARENARNKATAQVKEKQENVQEVSTEEIEEVILVDTGYLMRNGPSVITENVLPIFIPSFCISELEKMSRDNEDAKKLMLVITATNKIQTTNLRGKEFSYVKRPSFRVKDRIKGIVAAAVFLANTYPHVRVLTNSRDVKKLAAEQKCDGVNVVLEKIVA